jgi:hypothetical protein
VFQWTKKPDGLRIAINLNNVCDFAECLYEDGSRGVTFHFCDGRSITFPDPDRLAFEKWMDAHAFASAVRSVNG